jgi:hypothetical protein
MPIQLTEVNEKSTLVVTAAFTDENGDAVVPDSVTWTLTDPAGSVINGRNRVAVTPAASVTIVLSGDDLALSSTEASQTRGGRTILIEAAYTGDLGAGLPIKEAASFTIINLRAVS